MRSLRLLTTLFWFGIITARNYTSYFVLRISLRLRFSQLSYTYDAEGGCSVSLNATHEKQPKRAASRFPSTDV